MVIPSRREAVTVVVLLACMAAQPAAGQTVPIQLTYDPPLTGKDDLAWSPDGDWLAYVRAWWTGTQFSSAIYKVPAAGGPPTPVTPIAGFWQHRTTWSGDASDIYFTQKQATSRAYVGVPCRVSASSGQPLVLTSRQSWEIVLSRNGRWLAYMPVVGGNQPQQGIVLLNTISRRETTIVPETTPCWQMRFAPNGAMLGYRTPYAGILALMSGGTYSMYPWYYGLYIINWDWSPAGDRLALTPPLGWTRPFEGIVYPLVPVLYPYGYPSWSACGSYIAIGAGLMGSQGIAIQEVPSGRVFPVCIACFDGNWPVQAWSPFRDEIAWINNSSLTQATEVFKAPTGLSPVPAVVGLLTPGSRATIRIKASGDPNRGYVLGASLGTTPGIGTARGTIPLNPDPLLLASLSGSPMFHSFAGVLDASGRADAYIDIPGLRPGLVGARFFVAFVTLDPAQPAGIATISGAVPVFVQPTD